jgi:hypothetical protein
VREGSVPACVPALRMGALSLAEGLAVGLLVCYAALLGVVLAQAGRIVHHRHSKRSFQWVFLLLCGPWMALRVVLLALALVYGRAGVPVGVFVPLAWLPLNLEVASYTLLIVFFAQVIYRPTWEQRHRRRAIVGWVSGNAAFLVMTVVWMALVLARVITVDSKEAIFGRSLVTGCAFAVLAGLLAVFGFKLQRTLRQPAGLLAFKASGRSVVAVAVVTVALVLVFAARAVYCWVLAYVALALGRFPGDTPLFRFLAALLSEVVPTVVIVIFFWHVPSTPRRRRGASRRGGQGGKGGGGGGGRGGRRAGGGASFRFPPQDGATGKLQSVPGSPDPEAQALRDGDGGRYGYGAINNNDDSNQSDSESGAQPGGTDTDDEGAVAATAAAAAAGDTSPTRPHIDDDDSGDDDEGDAEALDVNASLGFRPAAARTAVVTPAIVRTTHPANAAAATARRTGSSGSGTSRGALAPAPAPAPAPAALPAAAGSLTASPLYLPSAADAVNHRAGSAFLAGGAPAATTATDAASAAAAPSDGATVAQQGWRRANGVADAAAGL